MLLCKCLTRDKMKAKIKTPKLSKSKGGKNVVDFLIKGVEPEICPNFECNCLGTNLNILLLLLSLDLDNTNFVYKIYSSVVFATNNN